MYAAIRRVLPLVAVALTVAGPAPAADAGWVTIQNDTGRVVVVQTTVTAGGHARRGRPVRLLPGETAREYHTAPSLQVEVFDGQPQDRSLFSGSFAVRPDPQTYLVTSSARGVTVTPAGGR